MNFKMAALLCFTMYIKISIQRFWSQSKVGKLKLVFLLLTLSLVNKSQSVIYGGMRQ